MAGTWKPEGMTWTNLAGRMWRVMNEDDIFGEAAKLAYYFVLSTVPMLMCVVTALGMFTRDEELRGRLLSYLNAFAPSSASALIYRVVEEIGQSGEGSCRWALSSRCGRLRAERGRSSRRSTSPTTPGRPAPGGKPGSWR